MKIKFKRIKPSWIATTKGSEQTGVAASKLEALKFLIENIRNLEPNFKVK